MRGHIAKEGNRYYAVIYEGTDPVNGRERHRWHPGGGTRKEAERLLTELVKRNHDGDYRAPERITLGTYLVERWLPTKKAQFRPSTFDSYRRNTEIHVIPRIGPSLCNGSRPRIWTRSTPASSSMVDATAPAVGSPRRRCGTSTA